jgi:uncharacterized protein
MTALVYWVLGLFSARSMRLVAPVAPAVLIGLPLGTYLIRHIPNETFRRVCMSFDAWIVGFGLARTFLELGLLGWSGAYSIWGAVILFDLYLLYRYFERGRIESSIENASADATVA